MASTTSSSPSLFEQPFSEMHFDGRLRRRENDSVQRDTAATPLFGSAEPFSTPRRKRKNYSNNSIERWVPRLFKAILWSPVAVVAIWCLSAGLFSHTRTGRARSGTVQVRPTSSKSRNNKQQAQQAMAEGGMMVAEVLESALGKGQPSGMLPVVAPLGSAQQPATSQSRFSKFVNGVTNLVRPASSKVIVQPANLYEQPAMGATGNSNSGGVYYANGIYQQPDGQSSFQQQPNMGSSNNNGGGVYYANGIYQQPDGQSSFQQQPNMGSSNSGGGVYYANGIYQQPDGQSSFQQQPNMGSSNNNGGGVYYANGIYQQPDGQSSFQQQPNMGSSNNNGGGVYYANGIYQQPDGQGSFQQQPNMGSGSNNGAQQQANVDASMEQQQQQQQPNMGSNGVNQEQQAAAAQDQPSMGSTGSDGGGIYYANGIYQQPNADGTYQQQPAMGSTGHNLRGSTQYLYYNPRDVVVMNGQVYLPQQVYDQNGQPHDLSRTRAQVYLQPPYGSALNTTGQPTMGSPAKSMSLPTQVTEAANASSILVATVGVVALLVGALSARHARGRACLNACLENEHLVASEAAYDAQHTTTNSYSTFWKGDLEKFDV